MSFEALYRILCLDIIMVYVMGSKSLRLLWRY